MTHPPAALRIRPIREDDAPAYRAFLAGLSPRTLRLRFMQLAAAPLEELVRFHTHIDPRRQIALVCEAQRDGVAAILGDARCVANPDGRSCELGIVVGDDWRHTGVAQALMAALLDAARRQGFETVEGLVLSENKDMLDFVAGLGFQIHPMARSPETVRVVRKL